MKRFFRNAFAHLLTVERGSRQRTRLKQGSLVLLLLVSCAVPIGLTTSLAGAQSSSPGTSAPTEKLRETNTQENKQRSGSTFALPSPPPKAPEVKAPPDGDPYVLEFNRSPVVGSSFSLRGIYDEARLGFTRPRNWKLKSVKALIRYRHSPALYATRSNLTVLINDASIGSIPLNRQEGEIGNAVFDVPLSQIQNYNQITVAALQNNSPTCTQDPYDPSLWTEILPDSKITFDFEPQPVSLDFNSYPYPIFDELSLYPNQLAYLLPNKVDNIWLTATSRLQASLGRQASFRRLETRLVKAVDEVELTERLVIIGTPAQQSALKSLELPMPLTNNQILDGKQKALPPNVGVLMLTTTPDNIAPVLVATGNGPEGVAKAVQFLVNSPDRKIGTGQTIIVENLDEVASPSPREWPGYLPPEESFQLSDLNNANNQPFEDVTVRGADSPPLEIDFKALPDDLFGSGNSMDVIYSYGPQVNAKTSLVEVRLDGVGIVGKRLTSINGGTREKLRVDLPKDKIGPTSKIQVDFRLDARERRSCSRVTDQQLWGTLHNDTSFNLNRTSTVTLPDLKLLRYGFPFAAPQDLSSTAIVLPDSPGDGDLMTLLEFSSRLGRLSKAESIQLDVYTKNSLPTEQRSERHLVGIGTQNNFPLPEVFESGGFELKDAFTRLRNQSDIQTSPDNEGVIKEIISPWNPERVLLALSSQTEKGLSQVQESLHQDPLFFQIEGDTALISANSTNPEIYDPNAYNFEFLQRAKKREVDKTPVPKKVFRFLAGGWFLLGPAIVAATLILYGVVQLYLKRISGQKT
ncbi:cellulose biosynthesis cyclic di-GMP-binding regulatory protein BcsB [Lyngbya aestuarii]|uniref:cellulose biosynthesis cyclic di-GMP-binding regulatory protein BcsB n=1 Tax=Lyngbya aestuarii TaxID=118322 RepID=UPI00403E16D7